jgi:hypothetical protein
VELESSDEELKMKNKMNLIGEKVKMVPLLEELFNKSPERGKS